MIDIELTDETDRRARPTRAGRPVWLGVALLALVLLAALALTRVGRPTNAATTSAAVAPAVSLPAMHDPWLWYNGWIHDGRWRVGVDVWPGVYRATVPIGPVDCAWTRYRRGVDGLHPVAAGGAAPGRQASLVVTDDDSVIVTVHCGWWHDQRQRR